MASTVCVYMEVKLGEKAPIFTLRAHDKSQVNLESFRGSHVVLLFFPLAFSRVCTEELKCVHNEYEGYANLDAHVLGVSVDSLYTLAEFRKVLNIGFPLLSDFNKEVSRAYDALHEEFGYEMKGVSKRAVFVVDPAGTLIHREVLENPGEMPDLQKIADVLSSKTH